MKGNDWLACVLATRRIASPNGKLLFSYRITDDEYLQLSEHLSNVVISSESALQKDQSCSMWLMFAAEWWRREYKGGSWSWEPVFSALGWDTPANLTVQQLVKRGREWWKLDEGPRHGKRFLGLVILNCGLPLHLIESAEGALVRLLRPVIREAVRFDYAYPTIRAEVENLQTWLPKSYRQAAIFDLLAQVVEAIKTHPADALVSNLPFLVSGKAAESLARGLEQEARIALAAEKSSDVAVRLLRTLRSDLSGHRQLESSIELSPKTGLQSFAKYFGVEASTLPAAFALIARVPGKSISIADAMIRRDEVRFVQRATVLPPEWDREQVALQISQFGHVLHESALPGAAFMDPDMPWIFKDAEPAANLLFVGGGTCRGKSALLSLPEHALVICEAGDLEELESHQEHPSCADRKLFRLPEGLTTVVYRKECYRLRIGASSGSSDSLLWHGKRYWYRSEPGSIFVGRPSLQRLSEEGALSDVSRQGQWHWTAGSAGRRAVEFSTPLIGAGVLSWGVNGDVLARQKIVCLPPEAEIAFLAEDNPMKGQIRLIGWPAIGMRIEGEHWLASIRQDGTTWVVSLEATSDADRKNDVEIHVSWPGSEVQTLWLPFPSAAALFVDAEGRQLPAGETLQLQDLVGARLRLLPGLRPATWEMELRLNDPAKRLESVRRSFFINQKEDVRLFEFKSAIETMLSATRSLDAAVVILVRHSNGKQVSDLRVARYSSCLERDEAAALVNLSRNGLASDALRSVSLMAINLSDPQFEAIPLMPCAANQAFPQTWDFSVCLQQRATWFIYADTENSWIRPLAWGTQMQDSILICSRRLCVAMSQRSKTQRQESLQQVLQDMVNDPEHEDWETLDRLVNVTAHLPLSSLEVWHELARIPQAMAMALFKLERFTDRLAQRAQLELPFDWAWIATDDWLTVMKRFRDQIESEVGISASVRRALVTNFQARIEGIGIWQPSIRFAMEVALFSVFGAHAQVSRESTMALQSPRALLEVLAEGQLSDQHGALQSMLQAASQLKEIRLPTDFSNEARDFLLSQPRKSLAQRIKVPSGDYKFHCVCVPIYLGYLTEKERSEHWRNSPSKVYALRSYRDFDPNWFDQAYVIGMLQAIVEQQLSN